MATRKKSSKSIPMDANEAIRERVKQILDEQFNGKQADMLRSMPGFPQSYLSTFISGKRKGAGRALILQLQKFDPTIGELFLSGLPEEDEEPVSQYTVYDSRYPNLDSAIQAHVNLGIAKNEAKTAADAVTVALDSDDDPPVRWWFDQIDAELKRKDWKPRHGERVADEGDGLD